MLNVNKLSPAEFLARSNLQLPKGVKYRDDSKPRREEDTACISKDGFERSEQLLAAREQAAKEKDATERYQAALELGQDYASHMDDNINQVQEDGYKSSASFLGFDTSRESNAFTTVSKQGTVVGVSYTAPHQDVAQTNYEVYTVQITRKDGFQLNIPFDEDMRINDLEDGSLSIYYAASGLTRTYDKEGRESVTEGETNALGSSSDDIILNRFSSKVDAGDGDDTIINLAKEAELLGGSGNDKIYVPGNTTRISIDGGAGDDIIVGHSFAGGKITMEEGNDSLIANVVEYVSVIATGDHSIKIGDMYNSSLDAKNGTLKADLAGITDTTVSIDKLDGEFVFSVADKSNITIGDGDTVFSGTLYDSNVLFGDGNISINSATINGSSITFGHGQNSISTSALRYSDVNSQNGSLKVVMDSMLKSSVKSDKGNDTIHVRSMNSSTISTGAGNDTIKAENGHFSKVNAGEGDNTIWVGESNQNTVTAGSGNNSIWLGSAADVARLDIHTGETSFVRNPERLAREQAQAASATNASNRAAETLFSVLDQAQAGNAPQRSREAEPSRQTDQTASVASQSEDIRELDESQTISAEFRKYQQAATAYARQYREVV